LSFCDFCGESRVVGLKQRINEILPGKSVF
jgi:hypothetical protein